MKLLQRDLSFYFSGYSRRVWAVHTLLFILTFVTATLAYAVFFNGGELIGSLSYSIPVMIILAGHEFGHYLQARFYGVTVSLPYFIPAPFPTGTMGAVIRMRTLPPSNRALFDIAFWGPAMSFLLALPALIGGTILSKVAPVSGTGDMIIFGDSILTRLITGILQDIPPNHDLVMHPLFFAGWVGMLITALNLMPVGQLDGGHVAYALIGRRQKMLGHFTVGILVLLLFETRSWLVWLVLIVFFIKIEHPDYRRAPVFRRVTEEFSIELRYQDVKEMGRRRMLGLLAALILLLSFIPVPVTEIPGLRESREPAQEGKEQPEELENIGFPRSGSGMNALRSI